MKEQELRRVIRDHIKRLMEAGPSLGAGGSDIERGLSKIEKRASSLTPRQRVAAVLPVLQKFGIQTNDLSLIKIELAKAVKQSAVQDASAEKAEADKEAAVKAKADAEAKAKADAEAKAKADAEAKKAAATKPATTKTTDVKSDTGTDTETPEKTEEQYTAGVDDNVAGKAFKRSTRMQENLSSLQNKGEKLDKTQAFQMLQRALSQKPSTMQADFVVDLINKFNLPDSAKRRLKMIIKNMA
jgi:regulator of protease activity HflC (stomatin/prohibitin superfamily)